MPKFNSTTAALRFEVEAAEAAMTVAYNEVRTINAEVGAVVLARVEAGKLVDLPASVLDAVEARHDAQARVQHYASKLADAERRLSRHIAVEVEGWAS